MSKNNIRVLCREQEWHRRKVKEAIYIKQHGPTMNRDQGYQLPPSTPRSFRRYLGQVTYNQCVIKICSLQIETSHSFQRNRSKVSEKITINTDVDVKIGEDNPGKSERGQTRIGNDWQLN